MKRYRTQIVYWLITGGLFSAVYMIYGSLTLGLLYGMALFPALIITCNGVIYKAVPGLLFAGHKRLFYLVAATIFLALINYALFLVYLHRVIFADLASLNIYVMQRDILYLIIGTLLFSVPIIFYETLSRWDEQHRISSDLEQQKKNMQQKLDEASSSQGKTIQIRSNGKNYRVQTSEIRYVEGMGDYVQIHLKDQKLMTLMTLKELEKLPELIRVHRSYLVNPRFCVSYSGKKIDIQDRQLPVSKTYREEVLEFMM